MNGTITSCTGVVRVPYGSSGIIIVTAHGEATPDCYAYTYNNGEQVLGSYASNGNGTSSAAIVITNDNETDSTVSTTETVYSFWNGDVRGTSSCTILKMPKGKTLPA